MSEGDDNIYKEAKQQIISLHVVHERVEKIMELHDPDHPEISDMKYVYRELKKFKEELLMTIGENADIVWYIDQNRGDGIANEG